MAEENSQQSPQPSEPSQRERLFLLNETVTVQQAGRVFRLSDTKYGSTYVIDVTDQPDPTTAEPPDKPMEVGATLANKLDEPSFNGQYASNNGVISLITDQLDGAHRSRAYLGIEMVDPNDPDAIEITSYVLNSAGFKPGLFYVPFSFDSQTAASLVKQEIVKATNTNLNLPQLEDLKS
jgi:hypothetical protein